LFDPARAVAELLKSYDSMFLRLVLESNEKRKRDLKMRVSEEKKRLRKEWKR